MRRWSWIAAILASALTPAIADAHLVTSGLGPLYDGAIHFALSPEDILPVLALALFAGLRGPEAARLALGTTTAAWIVGGGLTLGLGATPPPLALSAGAAALLLILGGLLAADVKLSPPLCALAAAALGLVRGAADVAGDPAGAGAPALLGMAGAVFTVFALAASLCLPLRRFWMIIAARVAGSWLAAVGLLLAGWILRFGERVH